MNRCRRLGVSHAQAANHRELQCKQTHFARSRSLTQLVGRLVDQFLALENIPFELKSRGLSFDGFTLSPNTTMEKKQNMCMRGT